MAVRKAKPDARLIAGLVMLVAMPIGITVLQNRYLADDPVADVQRFCERVQDIDSGTYPLPPNTSPDFRIALLKALWELAPDEVHPDLERMLRAAQGDPQISASDVDLARARVAAFLRRECNIALM